ncbi:Ionotropic receptor 396 [Blattella germanica]|nr:Ionotropic receptor 396 [Blattella germanica]
MDNTVEHYLAECIINISSTYFNTALSIAVQTPSNWYLQHPWDITHGETLLKILNNEIHIPILTYGPVPDDYNSSDSAPTPDSYIFLISAINSDEEMNVAFSMFYRVVQEVSNGGAHVIIALVEPFNNINHIISRLQYIFSVAFYARFSRVILVVPHKSRTLNNPKEIDIYGWLPNEQVNICSRFVRIVRFFDAWKTKERRFLLGFNLFTVDSKINLNNCQINVTYYGNYPVIYPSNKRVDGIAVLFLDAFSKVFNCTVKYNSSKSSHMQFPVFYTNIFKSDGHELTYPYFQMDINWFVPAGIEIPRWQSIVRVFPTLMWGLVAATSVCGTFTLWLTLKHRRSSDDHQTGGHSILITALLNQLGFGDDIECKGPLAVMFYILWLYYCLLINNAYQAGLYGLLVQPGQYPPIETYEELMESGLRLKTKVKIDLGYDAWGVIKQYEDCEIQIGDAVEACLDEMASTGNFAVLVVDALGRVIAKLLYEKHGKDKISRINKPMGNMFLGFQISKMAYILHNAMDTLLHRAVQGGLLDKWNFDELHKWEMNRKVRTVDTVKPFTFEHVQGGFYLLSVGILIAFLAFIFEISHNFCHKLFV